MEWLKIRAQCSWGLLLKFRPEKSLPSLKFFWYLRSVNVVSYYNQDDQSSVPGRDKGFSF